MTSSDDDMLAALEKRLGRLHARQRLGIEKDHEAQIFGQGLTFFHPENAMLSRWLISFFLDAHRTLLARNPQFSEGRTAAQPHRHQRPARGF